MVSTPGREVTVVGAGVIGLTTAVELERRGHRVQVVAEATYERTVSSVAGAIWFPYQVGPDDRARVQRWAQVTRAWLGELAASTPAAGVDVLDAYELPVTEELPWWAHGLDDVARAAAPVAGAPEAWRFRAPRAEPALLLGYLSAQLRRPVELRRVDALAELPGDVVVNCTGLGARALVGDDALQAVFGQVAIASPGTFPLQVTLTDERDPDSLFYVIPRRGELVLGGVARPQPATAPLAVEPAITERVLGHAAALGLSVGDVADVRVGLRPVRPRVRLERDAADARVVHNYGHGGAGFTLGHGAACAVADLIEEG
ncbi:MAG: FAD-dependent oxidoreductase [Kofleriaceae bacterium]